MDNDIPRWLYIPVAILVIGASTGVAGVLIWAMVRIVLKVT